MKDIFISVIIPVYNISAYIGRCLSSVMRQTYNDFECIIVDDASSDDSIVICEQMIAAYQGPIRFRILRHTQNRGLSAVRNTGTDAATGNCILYVDGDDVITDDCIEKLSAPILSDDTIEMVMGDFECVDEKSGAIFHIRKHKCGDYPTNESVRQCYYEQRGICEAAWNKLVSKDFLVRHELSFREGVIWEDLLWTFYLMKHLRHLYAIKDVTYRKYQTPESICMSTDEKKKLYYYGLIYDEISNNFSPNDNLREAKFYIRNFNRKYFNSQQDETYNHAANNFKKSLSLWDIPGEFLLLSTIYLLSKTFLGRRCIHGFRTGLRLIKHI